MTTDILTQPPSNLRIPNQIPYGYKIHPNFPNQLVINEDVAAYVHFMFDEYLRGETLQKISQRLNNISAPTLMHTKIQAGVKNRRSLNSTYWDSKSIRKVLINSVYSGKYRCLSKWLIPPSATTATDKNIYLTNKSFYIPCPSYITQKQYNQIVSEHISKKSKSCKVQENHSIYQGLIFCSACGSSLYLTSNYYKCSSHKYHHPNACKPVRHYMHLISDHVHKLLIEEAMYAKELNKKYSQGFCCPDFIEYTEILKKAFQYILTRLANTLYTESENQKLHDQLKELICEIDKIYQIYSLPNLWLELYTNLPEDFELTKISVPKYINEVIISPGGKVQIKTKYESYRASMQYYTNPQNAKSFIKQLGIEIQI